MSSTSRSHDAPPVGGQADIRAAAGQLLSLIDSGALHPAQRASLDDLDRARAVQSAINDARLGQGEEAIGYKIGFTSRAAWPALKVDAPMWAPMWKKGLVQLPSEPVAPVAEFSLRDTPLRISQWAQPRIEAEIIVGLKSVPEDSSIEAVSAAIDWVSQGFEICDSPWPDWKFIGAEAIAAQGLHAAIVVGPRRHVLKPDHLAELLREVELTLVSDGVAVAEGSGENVLGGPIEALCAFLDLLKANPPARKELALKPGSIIATGTLVPAEPMRSGQHWSTALRFPSREQMLKSTLSAPLADVRMGS